MTGLWLAIDSATDVAGVALHDGTAVTAEAHWTSRRRHTVELAPAVDALLRRQGVTARDLAGIAVALGPGSYTGLRIGLALAKGVALGAGIPVVGVPTLDILAAALSPPGVPRTVPLWAVLNAGRGRLVAALYPPGAIDGGEVESMVDAGEGEPCWPDLRLLTPMTPADLAATAQPPAWVAGEIDATARAILADAGLTCLPAAACLRRAGWLAEIGRRRWAAGGAGTADSLVPIYLDPSSASTGGSSVGGPGAVTPDATSPATGGPA